MPHNKETCMEVTSLPSSTILCPLPLTEKMKESFSTTFIEDLNRSHSLQNESSEVCLFTHDVCYSSRSEEEDIKCGVLIDFLEREEGRGRER